MNKNTIIIASFILQVASLACIFVSVRTYILYIPILILFLTTIITCYLSNNKSLSLLAVIILLIGLHCIRIAIQMPYGEAWFSDSIADYSVAKLISDAGHFEIGQVGYSARVQTYSYFPLLHILFATLSVVTSLDAYSLGVWILPILNSMLIAYCIFGICITLGLNLRSASYATIIYGTCYYYIFAQSSFLRESYTFPLFLFLLLQILRTKSDNHFVSRVVVIILLTAIIIGHGTTSYVLILFLVTIALTKINNRMPVLLSTSLIVLSIVMVFSWGIYMALQPSTIFVSGIVDQYLVLLVRVFQGDTTLTMMGPQNYVEKMLGYTYYILFGLLLFVGAIIVFKNYDRQNKYLLVCCAVLFASAVLSRTHFTSFGWGAGHRLLIYAYIGLVPAIGLAIDLLMQKTKITQIFTVIIILVMAAGALSQQTLLFTNRDIKPIVTYSVNTATLWLKQYAISGTLIGFDSDLKTDEAIKSLTFALAANSNLKDFAIVKNFKDQYSGYFVIPGLFAIPEVTYKMNYIYAVPDLTICYIDGHYLSK